MSWRSIQLAQNLCDQDKIILNLFKDSTVKYVGGDQEFKQHLHISDTASNLVLVINNTVWCSDVIAICQTHLIDAIDKFYIGVNRYTLLGNDTCRNMEITNQPGNDYNRFLTSIVNDLGFCVLESGTFDNDLGRYFNFVQPLTWIYGNKITNKGN